MSDEPRPFELEGRVAVVTGGAGGIGRALAAMLAAEGCRLAVVDLDPARAEEAASALPGGARSHIGLGVDVGERAAVEAMVVETERRLGPIDVYCSNAGIATGPGLGDDGMWEAGWRVHAMAHVHAARSVLPGMSERGSGVFVVTASAAGLLMMMQSAAYTATKHASVAIAEWLAVNYGGSGVRFHCLCPQGVLTPMVTGGSPTAESELRASGHLLEPVAVAEAVLEAIRADRFMVLPHPEVQRYEQAKVADRDRWLGGMRRLLQRVTG
ncbi:MAG: SDR family NAD(P)-dependent oxidoreductase [Actinomycetota bacterium]|nr:SDR family NAD(P)-dependent oxidoreductase [Actinomycetota bacterium]